MKPHTWRSGTLFIGAPKLEMKILKLKNHLPTTQNLEEDEIDEDEEPQEEGNNLSMEDLSECVGLAHAPNSSERQP